VNTGAPWPDLYEAESRVLGIQAKLHQWAIDSPDRVFDDLYNLVCDPAFLVVAWGRVKGNRGARSAGVDGVKPRSIVFGSDAFLAGLRDDLKAHRFVPLPVREKLIPKKGGKLRGLGIPTARDRTVQAALKLVIEPIFEVDFRPCSYGFRPRRRAHDAIAEINYLASRSYEWVLEGDIEACFDRISHPALLARVRQRVGDKRVMGLVKAFLKAGVLSEDGAMRDTVMGTPQGGILSPLLSNIALSVLDDHFAKLWQDNGDYHDRARRRRHGLANYRIIRYADDFVVLVSGNRGHAEGVRDQVAAVLAPMGLVLSEHKTSVCHIDEGFVFLGFRIQRKTKRGSVKRYVYTYPSKQALASVTGKVRALTRRGTNPSLEVLLYRLNPVLRGWTNYFRHGVSKATFNYLRAFVWQRVVRWLRRKHPKATWKQLRRRYLPGWWPTEGETSLFNPGGVVVTRYRFRGSNIPSPWPTSTERTVA
jgi:RNA-directed DNA polymerase